MRAGVRRRRGPLGARGGRLGGDRREKIVTHQPGTGSSCLIGCDGSRSASCRCRSWSPRSPSPIGAQQPGPRPGQAGGQQPARDTPAQPKDAPPPPAGRITGRVLAADNGRPVKRARVFVIGGRTARRPRHADRRQRRVRPHRAAGGPLHADGVEVRVRLALVRPAPAAAGRHAAAARRRPAAEGDRVPAAARQRHRRPRPRRGRRRDAGRDGARHALPVPAGRAAADAGRQRPDRRQGALPRLGPDARRLLRQRDRARRRTGRRAVRRARRLRRRARRTRRRTGRRAARPNRNRSTTRRPTIPASRRSTKRSRSRSA